MKKAFYLSLLALILFEAANVYFIMPMPGSQQMNSIGIAYFLYKWRWIFRIVLLVLLLYAFIKTQWRRRWIPLCYVIIVAVITYFINFKMAADHMFYQPSQLIMKDAAANVVDTNRLVLGIEINGAAKAYPIQFIGYHHQVLDTLAGKPIMVTYCTVCRTGRIFEPTVNGKQESFRLVGMDHFNAMFEDKTTGSWWRQATGEAIVGKHKGNKLPALPAVQMSLGRWLALRPNSLVMQPDTAFQRQYNAMASYESGDSKSSLTRMDSASWLNKSWVVGIVANGQAKAYDWNRLVAERVINDAVGNTPIVLALANDNKSFVAFVRPSAAATFTLQQDTLRTVSTLYNLKGKWLSSTADTIGNNLRPIIAYQEYWHSWQTFHPGTGKY